MLHNSDKLRWNRKEATYRSFHSPSFSFSLPFSLSLSRNQRYYQTTISSHTARSDHDRSHKQDEMFDKIENHDDDDDDGLDPDGFDSDSDWFTDEDGDSDDDQVDLDSFLQDSNGRRDHEIPSAGTLSGKNLALESIIDQGFPTLQRIAHEIDYRTKRNRPIMLRSRSYDNTPGAVDSQLDQNGSSKKSSDKNQESYLEQSLYRHYNRNTNLRQEAESARILETATDCLEELAVRYPSQTRLTGLTIGGEPIIFLHCQVNRDARQAKLYWALPYTLLLDERLTQRAYQQLVERIQFELVYGTSRGKYKRGWNEATNDNRYGTNSRIASTTTGAKLLGWQVHSRLSSYYPPRIKLLPATDEMVSRVIEEYGML